MKLKTHLVAGRAYTVTVEQRILNALSNSQTKYSPKEATGDMAPLLRSKKLPQRSIQYAPGAG
jgi:hypothetical protein